MNRGERKAWFRRIRREDKAKSRELALHKGTLNSTRESPISRSKYLGNNFAYLYNHTDVSRALNKGNFKTTTVYSRHERTRIGSGHIGFHWVQKRPSDGWVSFDDSFVALYDPGWCSIWSGYTDTAGLSSKLHTAAQNAMLSRISKDYASWDALTDVVEGRQLGTLLLQTARRVNSLVSGVIKKDPIQVLEAFSITPTRKRVKRCRNVFTYHYANPHFGKGVTNAVSELWLTYSWGLRPTVLSIEDALKALLSPDPDKDYVFTSQVTLSDELSTSTPVYSWGSPCLTLNGNFSRKCKGSVRKKAYYRFTPGIVSRVNANTAYSLISTGWELTPFSDCIDWFINIGPYLANLKLQEVLATISVNVTEKGETVTRSEFLGYSVAPSYSTSDVQNFCSGYSSSWKSFVRTVGSSSIPSPTLEQGLYNTYRQLTAAALAWQGVKQRVKTVSLLPHKP